MEREYKELKLQIDTLAEAVDSGSYDEEKATSKYYVLEEELQQFEGNNIDEIDLTYVKRQMKTIKRKLDLYDADGELDRMFPNRHDNDFDEDEMSGESFFKD